MATRIDNHGNYVITVKVHESVVTTHHFDVSNVTGGNDSQAKSEAVRQYQEKHAVTLDPSEILEVKIEDKTVNEVKSRRYYEGYRRGLGRPVEVRI